MSEGNIENITKSDSNFAPTVVDNHVLPDINFNEHCLINNIYIPKKVINIYISYTLNPRLRNLKPNFTLKNCLFGSLKLTKNSDPATGSFSCSEFSFTDGSMGKNVMFFGPDMSSSAHIDNEDKDILIFCVGPTQ